MLVKKCFLKELRLLDDEFAIKCRPFVAQFQKVLDELCAFIRDFVEYVKFYKNLLFNHIFQLHRKISSQRKRDGSSFFRDLFSSLQRSVFVGHHSIPVGLQISRALQRENIRCSYKNKVGGF